MRLDTVPIESAVGRLLSGYTTKDMTGMRTMLRNYFFLCSACLNYLNERGLTGRLFNGMERVCDCYDLTKSHVDRLIYACVLRNMGAELLQDEPSPGRIEQLMGAIKAMRFNCDEFTAAKCSQVRQFFDTYYRFNATGDIPEDAQSIYAMRASVMFVIFFLEQIFESGLMSLTSDFHADKRLARAIRDSVHEIYVWTVQPPPKRV